jgi:hypothetical protein
MRAVFLRAKSAFVLIQQKFNAVGYPIKGVKNFNLRFRFAPEFVQQVQKVSTAQNKDVYSLFAENVYIFFNYLCLFLFARFVKTLFHKVHQFRRGDA